MKLYEPISARNLKKKLKSRMLDEQDRYIDMFIIHIYMEGEGGRERERQTREGESFFIIYVYYICYILHI